MTEQNSTEMALPNLKFTFNETVSEWNVSHREWLKSHNKTWDSLATGALVFDASNRILLLQRAPDDSMPNKWEIPGGACDDEDESVLHGCVRELWEETGLKATHIRHVIPDNQNGKPGAVFTNRTGKRFFCKFSFEVDVALMDVKLDPKEHQDYVWATEEEAKQQCMGEREIPLTNAIMVRIVEMGFALRKANQGGRVQSL